MEGSRVRSKDGWWLTVAEAEAEAEGGPTETLSIYVGLRLCGSPVLRQTAASGTDSLAILYVLDMGCITSRLEIKLHVCM